MNQSFLQSIKFSWYFYILIIISIICFFVSGNIYKLKKNRIEPFALYYPAVSAVEINNNKENYLAEVRNVPVQKIEYTSFFSLPSTINIEILIEELFLGPQNIYAKHIVPGTIQLSHVFVQNVDFKRLFVILQYKQNLNSKKESEPDSLQKEAIRNWLEYNINKYFKFDKIIILYEHQ